MILESPAFEHGTPLARQFTCDGENVSPPLAWQGVPEEAKSLVLICDDPDAPTPKPWVHWLVFNIPLSVTSFAQAAVITSSLQGKNDFGNSSYGGPCPPHGHGEHRYYFTLYALDVASLRLTKTATRKQIEQAMHGHDVARAVLMGTYQRAGTK